MPRHLARALLLGILLTGCTETDSAATEHDSTVETVTPTRRPLTVTDVDLDAAVADLCVVRSSFEVDPTRIDDHEQSPWLAALASCITTGPLQGRSLELVAHTSIHHDSPYARRLGESRADSLRARLIENGVDASEVRSSAAVVGDERSVVVRIAARQFR
jgi:outer membrane protein OmpA-like peptidoglycan-associated protein